MFGGWINLASCKKRPAWIGPKRGETRMRSVFLDRDGIINEHRVDFVKSWDEFHFLPGALTALRWLRLAGFQTFVVTNQPIIDWGLAPATVIEDINTRMALQVLLHGGRIHDIRYCPHCPAAGCRCHGPNSGLITDLATHWHIDLSRSYVISSAASSIGAEQISACRRIVIERKGAQAPPAVEAYLATDLLDAVEWLFRREDLTPPCHQVNVHEQRPTSIGWGPALPALG